LPVLAVATRGGPWVEITNFSAGRPAACGTAFLLSERCPVLLLRLTCTFPTSLVLQSDTPCLGRQGC
jgi:hypothetical protein